MRSPPLKWLLIPMALVLLFVGIKLFSGDRSTKPAASGASQLTSEEMKSLRHRGRHTARHRGDAGGPGQATPQRTTDGAQRQQEPESRERAHARPRECDRPAHPRRAGRRARPPATRPRPGLQRSAADPEPAARPAAPSRWPVRQGQRTGRPTRRAGSGRRRRQELRRRQGRQRPWQSSRWHALGPNRTTPSPPRRNSGTIANAPSFPTSSATQKA